VTIYMGILVLCRVERRIVMNNLVNGKGRSIFDIEMEIVAERAIDPDVAALYEVNRLVVQGLVLAGYAVVEQEIPPGRLVLRYRVDVPLLQYPQKSLSAFPLGDMVDKVVANGVCEEEKKRGTRGAKLALKERTSEPSPVLTALVPVIKNVYAVANKKLAFKVVLDVDEQSFVVGAADVASDERVIRLEKRWKIRYGQAVLSEQSQIRLQVCVPKRVPALRG
jgi:hypothetical protein